MLRIERLIIAEHGIANIVNGKLTLGECITIADIIEKLEKESYEAGKEQGDDKAGNYPKVG